MTACSESSAAQAINLLTICKKAGRLVIGFDAAKEAVTEGKAACLVLTADASAKTQKEVHFLAAGQIPVLRLETDMDTLAAYLRRRIAVLAICDAGFAKRFAELLAPAVPTCKK